MAINLCVLQAGEVKNQGIEPFFATRYEIVLNSKGFDSEQRDMSRVPMDEIIGMLSSEFRFPPCKKSEKIKLSLPLSSFRVEPPSLGISTSGQSVTEPAQKKSTDHANNRRDKICHILLWGMLGFVLGRVSSVGLQQSNHFVEAPNMIANSCFHSGRYSERLVNPAEVVIHEVECQRVLVIL